MKKYLPRWEVRQKKFKVTPFWKTHMEQPWETIPEKLLKYGEINTSVPTVWTWCHIVDKINEIKKKQRGY